MNWSEYEGFEMNRKPEGFDNKGTPTLNPYVIHPPNGRVVKISDEVQGGVPPMIANEGRADPTLKESLGNIVTRSELSDLYFSTYNQDQIQKSIRYEVWKKSDGKFVIDRQSDTELSVIMRAMFFQFAKYLPFDIPGQVNELNKYVVDYCVPIILSNVQQYQGYLYDAEHMPMPIEHPKNLSNKGSKTLPSVTSTYPQTGLL